MTKRKHRNIIQTVRLSMLAPGGRHAPDSQDAALEPFDGNFPNHRCGSSVKPFFFVFSEVDASCCIRLAELEINTGKSCLFPVDQGW